MRRLRSQGEPPRGDIRALDLSTTFRSACDK
jgi:hypothetical protein